MCILTHKSDVVYYEKTPHPAHNQQARHRERDQPGLAAPTLEELTHSARSHSRTASRWQDTGEQSGSRVECDPVNTSLGGVSLCRRGEPVRRELPMPCGVVPEWHDRYNLPPTSSG